MRCINTVALYHRTLDGSIGKNKHATTTTNHFSPIRNLGEISLEIRRTGLKLSRFPRFRKMNTFVMLLSNNLCCECLFFVFKKFRYSFLAAISSDAVVAAALCDALTTAQ